MSSLLNFNSQHAKLEMARILPADAILVIFTDSSSAQAKEEILTAYGSVVPRERIRVVTLPGAGSGFLGAGRDPGADAGPGRQACRR